MAIIHVPARQHVIIEDPLPLNMLAKTLVIQHKVTKAQSVISVTAWNADDSPYTKEDYEIVSEKSEAVNLSAAHNVHRFQIPTTEDMGKMDRNTLIELAKTVGIADVERFKSKQDLILELDKFRA